MDSYEQLLCKTGRKYTTKIARSHISLSFEFSCSLHFSTVDSRIHLPCTSIIPRDPAVGAGVVLGWKQRRFPTL